MDDLLVKLRKLKLGCHVAGLWMGACAYCDDLTLLAPNRQVLQQMVTICEKYGIENNLVFSTDPNPNKSKTKCVLFCGPDNRTRLPDPVLLDGKELPWVEKCEHLGHVLHQTLSMESDFSRTRGSFMARASDLRDQLGFADPWTKMQAINLNCCDAYGSMLWDLQSDYCQRFFKAWNIQARLSFDVPRATHTYLVEGALCEGLASLRRQILSRYPNFTRNLRNSPSFEIRFLFRILENDPASTTYKNMLHLKTVCGEDVFALSTCRVLELVPETPVPANEEWRRRLLAKFLQIKATRSYNDFNLSYSHLCEMIDSLCIN